MFNTIYVFLVATFMMIIRLFLVELPACTTDTTDFSFITLGICVLLFTGIIALEMNKKLKPKAIRTTLTK
jgi:hypothetical protein